MTTAVIEGLNTTLKVGLEIHVELATRTKMWTAMPNVAHPDYYDAEPNSLIDPIVVGMPGTLPVMNRAALDMAIKVGLALNCEIARWSKWDRKSYWYPDLPKNYQISQYDLPICGAGEIEIPASEAPDAARKTVRITRAHLEEDAGKLLHEAPGGRPIDHTIVDLNRAGTPLLEIVTEPDLNSPEEVVMFGRTLRNICRFLGVSEGVMQRGHMRFEPNINVIIEKGGTEYATPVVEIKNLNSFKAVAGAVAYEHQRQVEAWLEDGVVMGARVKTTRGWDDDRGVTTLQRHKEDADEYRYFPDPDLVPVEVDDAWLDTLRAEIPELPMQREKRYVEEYGLDHVQARFLTSEYTTCEKYEEALHADADPERAASFFLNDLAKQANEQRKNVGELPITGKQIAELLWLREENQLSARNVEVTATMINTTHKDVSISPSELARAQNLIQVSDAEKLERWCEQAIDAEPQAADDVRAGNMKAIGRLVGAVMKLSRSQANPKAVQQKLRETLGR